MRVAIAAGGTGGHIFPALSVALEWRKQDPGVSLVWFGTERSRERELCNRHGIPLVILKVAGLTRRLGLGMLQSAALFVRGLLQVHQEFRRQKPDLVVAFGGYVSAPVLSAAYLMGIPYFVHEQNTVAGLVNRLFADGADVAFLGFPLDGGKKLGRNSRVVGTPVRNAGGAYAVDDLPKGFDVRKKSILVCGGSQGALTMDRLLVRPALHWASLGFQVVWQTGQTGYEEVSGSVAGVQGVFAFPTIEDLYPVYSCVQVVVGRAGASTLSEAAYFGLPCVIIPLPWAAENHQWKNAGLAEAQGWGVRVRQDERCPELVDKHVIEILTNGEVSERMSQKALDNSPANAAQSIVRAAMELKKA